MGRRVTPIDREALANLPLPCAACTFWELGVAAAPRGSQRAADQKAAWLDAVLLEWGHCGHLVSVDGRPAGFSLFAPARHLDQAGSQAARPVSRDAVLLATLVIVPGFQGQGLGRVLLQTMARDLSRRRIRAAEAFADRHWTGGHCHLPAAFLEASGFQVVREHPRFPRMRMDLRTALRWKNVGEAALDRLRVPVPAPVPWPAPVSDSAPQRRR